MFKFIHAADIHLDSPLTGLERYEGMPVDAIRGALRGAFENLVRLALREKVAFVLIAGDLFDRGWRDYGTALYFVNKAAELAAAGIAVVFIAGNHDAANKMTHGLRLPKRVHRLADDKPESLPNDNCDVMIHGQSFKKEQILDNLSAGYPKAQPGRFNIGILHTCATSTEHERYAPCTMDDLLAKGYDYWALGHIHKREQLHDNPIIGFSGNIQGRHIRETGPKGCLLVTVTDQRQPSAEFRSLDVVRWRHCQVDVSDAASTDDVLDRVELHLAKLLPEAEDLPHIVRVEITGRSAVHQLLHAQPTRWVNEIRAQAMQVGGELLCIEQVKMHTCAPGHDWTDDATGPLAEIRTVVQEWRTNDDAFETVRAELEDLTKKLPAELLEDVEGGHALGSKDWLRPLLDHVDPLLAAKLTGTLVAK